MSKSTLLFTAGALLVWFCLQSVDKTEPVLDMKLVIKVCILSQSVNDDSRRDPDRELQLQDCHIHL